MLNKPFFITFLLSVIPLCVALTFEIISRIIGITGINENTITSVTFTVLVAIFVGQTYAEKYKKELPRIYKFKVSLYYFLVQMILGISFIAFIKKDYPNNFILRLIFIALFLSTFVSFLVYISLGHGCKIKLKKLGITISQG